MNFLQISQKAHTCSGFQGSLSNAATATGYQATLVDYVKQAWIDIQDKRKNWPFMRSSVDITTTASTSEYSLTDIFGASNDLARWYYIVYIDSDDHVHLMREYTYDQYIIEEVSNSGTSIPDIYSIDPVDKHLYINPPADTYDITAYYYTQPVTLTNNTDTPSMNASFHILISYLAAAYMCAEMGNGNLYNINISKADTMLGNLYRSELPGKKIRVYGIA